jgi:hypothetical protein
MKLLERGQSMAGENAGTPERPKPGKRGKRWRIAVAAFLAGLTFLVALPFPLCRDMGFVCKHTASRKGYRMWFGGLRTGSWYSESRLERFMVEKYPQNLTHRWVSFMGTGRNLLGQPISFRHGWPNKSLLQWRETFDDYVGRLDDAGKLELYRVLSSGQEEEIEARLAPVREMPFEPFRDRHR